jgi:hypothetical protein
LIGGFSLIFIGDFNPNTTVLNINLSNGISRGIYIGSGVETQSGDLTRGIDFNPESETVISGFNEGVDKSVETVLIRSQFDYIIADLNGIGNGRDIFIF